jgi:hypothetical protein
LESIKLVREHENAQLREITIRHQKELNAVIVSNKQVSRAIPFNSISRHAVARLCDPFVTATLFDL